ncbi:MAG: dCTP deaminase [Chloroflexi bacterium]|nr:dCTP deaminase [Chloroflexota bacterium]
MILSDRDIRLALAEGRIRIDPTPDLATQLGSCSIDLRLGNTFRVFEHSRFPYIDLRQPEAIAEFMRQIDVPAGDPFVMQPGGFALATTVEWLELADDLVARLEGRSSLGRLGIIVHGTASVFDPGWVGHPTIELGNFGVMPVALYPGMRICSFTFEQLSSPAEVPYWKKRGNKYAGQRGPEASKLADEFRA